LFFRGSGVLITDSCVQVNGTWHPVGSLTELSEGRGPSGPVPARLAVVAGGVTLADCVMMMAAGSSAAQILIGGLAIILVTTMGAVALVWWRSRPYELWVRCRGEQFMIYTHRDPVEFHKFQRALWRAMNGEAPKAFLPGMPVG
jgi:hypothetical protein